MPFFPDLRRGAVALPEPGPGYDPAGDASALLAAGSLSPAREPILGHDLRGSFGPGSRYIVRIPLAWNGKLAVCGTPAMRSEYANDGILGDFLLARGYAVAASNKGIPYNARLIASGPAGAPGEPTRAYPVPFALGEAPAGTLAFESGALDPAIVPVAAWQEDLPRLVRAATDCVVRTMGREPDYTYALGLSIGGGQVRYLLERYPELVDGGLEWASVYWHPDHNILTYLPAFLKTMPAYVASGYRDRAAHDAIVAAGFPPDRVTRGAKIPSLWDAHYSGLPPFYADFTVFAFAHLLDPEVGDLTSLEARAAYVPSDAARAEIERFAHTGKIERPLIGIAGDADVFITPQQNFEPYVAAVRAAGRSDLYWPYLVRDGTHSDQYVDYGWNLRTQLPFVWNAFECLEGIVERNERPASPGEIVVVSDASLIRHR